MLITAKSARFMGHTETDAVVQLLSMDSTDIRAHQHSAGTRKPLTSEVMFQTDDGTGGTLELQEFAGRTR